METYTQKQVEQLVNLIDDAYRLHTRNNILGWDILEEIRIKGFPDEYPLSYNDLINGKYYTHEYSEQGKYTFKNGYNFWIFHKGSFPQSSNSGNFTPENRFTKFRFATEEEIKLLD